MSEEDQKGKYYAVNREIAIYRQRQNRDDGITTGNGTSLMNESGVFFVVFSGSPCFIFVDTLLHVFRAERERDATYGISLISGGMGGSGKVNGKVNFAPVLFFLFLVFGGIKIYPVGMDAMLNQDNRTGG